MRLRLQSLRTRTPEQQKGRELPVPLGSQFLAGTQAVEWPVPVTNNRAQADVVGWESGFGLGCSGKGHSVEKEGFNGNWPRKSLHQLSPVKRVTQGQEEGSRRCGEGCVSRFTRQEGLRHCTSEEPGAGTGNRVGGSQATGLQSEQRPPVTFFITST